MAAGRRLRWRAMRLEGLLREDHGDLNCLYLVSNVMFTNH